MILVIHYIFASERVNYKVQLFKAQFYTELLSISSLHPCNTNLPLVRSSWIRIHDGALLYSPRFYNTMESVLLYAFVQLYKKYPNKPMMLNLTAHKPPTMQISTQTVNLTLPTYIQAFVQNGNGSSYTEAFTLQMVSFLSIISQWSYFSVSSSLASYWNQNSHIIIFYLFI